MRRAFTLVELLGVIVILSIIGVLVMPLVLNVINESRDNINDAQIESIKRAARDYTTAHLYSLKCEPNCKVSIQTLIDEGYLEAKDIKNAKTDENINKSDQVEIHWNGTKYSYKYPIN